MKNLLSLLITLPIFLSACNLLQAEPLDSTPTRQPTTTHTATRIPAPTKVPTSTPIPTPTESPTSTPIPTPTTSPTPTPIPIKYVTLGPPFHADCGTPLLVCDNSFNGRQGEIDSHHGHFDIWPSDCDPDAFEGEVIAPASGTIEKHPHSYGIVLPQDTYLENMEFALSFMGIDNPSLSLVKGLSIDLGHLELLQNIEPGDSVEKGQPLGNLIESESLFPILAYQINLWYGADAIDGRYDDTFYMASPTLFKNDVTYPINFAIPEDSAYETIYPNSKGPWLFSSRVPELFGDWWSPYYCYPEPMAYP